MNVLIIGCGKTGARLATQLDEYGYDVAVIDADERAFQSLGERFSGLPVCGVVTDMDVLRNAGADNADLAVVVTDNDNVNVMAAQTLELEFDVKNTFVRVSDPSREAVFRKFGLRTICPTRLESDLLFSLVSQDSEDIDSISMGGTAVHFSMEKADKKEIGRMAHEVATKPNTMLFAVRRKTGKLLFYQEDLEIEDGDMLIFAKE